MRIVFSVLVLSFVVGQCQALDIWHPETEFQRINARGLSKTGKTEYTAIGDKIGRWKKFGQTLPTVYKNKGIVPMRRNYQKRVTKTAQVGSVRKRVRNFKNRGTSNAEQKNKLFIEIKADLARFHATRSNFSGKARVSAKSPSVRLKTKKQPKNKKQPKKSNPSVDRVNNLNKKQQEASEVGKEGVEQEKQRKAQEELLKTQEKELEEAKNRLAQREEVIGKREKALEHKAGGRYGSLALGGASVALLTAFVGRLAWLNRAKSRIAHQIDQIVLQQAGATQEQQSGLQEQENLLRGQFADVQELIARWQRKQTGILGGAGASMIAGLLASRF